MNIVSQINNKIAQYFYLECNIYSIQKENVTIAASEDLLYYHNFEIEFVNVFTVICNKNWKIDTKVISFFELDPANNVELEEMKKVNIDFRVETGNRIFKFVTEDSIPFYFAAEDVRLTDKVVKY